MSVGTAVSRDDTRLAFWREGSGPPLLLVHGGACDHMAWYYVAPLLARRFTVYSYDRRGRGASGDTAPYAVAREVEDVEAMLGAIGEPAYLLGHSAGGILAEKTAERRGDLLGLILYEPAFVVEGARERPAPEVQERIQALLAARDRDEVIRLVMRETLGSTESEIAAVSAGPGWEQLLAVAHAVPYDWQLWQEPFDPARAKQVQVRTLVLMGSDSPMWLQIGARTVAAALPGAQLRVLAGQQHHAMLTAPDLFAQRIEQFAFQTNEVASAH